MFHFLSFDPVYTDPVSNTINIVILHSFTILSVLINCFIFYVTAKRDNVMGKYRYLLLTYSAQDTLYSIMHHLVYPIAESHENSFLVSGRGVLDSAFSTCFFMGIFGTSSPLITGNFCYRLLLLKGNAHRIPFSRIYLAILAYAFVGGYSWYDWFAFGRYASAQDADTDRVLGALLNGSVPSPVIHTPENAEKYITAMFWNGATFEGARWKVLLTVFGISVMLFGNYCIMVICTLLITRLIEEQSMSTSTIQLQRQLLRSLIGQTLFPLFTIYAAAFVAMIPPMLGSHYAGVAYFIPNLCGVHPLADGLVLVITVSQYRKVFLRIFSCRGSTEPIVYEPSESFRSTVTVF